MTAFLGRGLGNRHSEFVYRLMKFSTNVRLYLNNWSIAEEGECRRSVLADGRTGLRKLKPSSGALPGSEPPAFHPVVERYAQFQFHPTTMLDSYDHDMSDQQLVGSALGAQEFDYFSMIISSGTGQRSVALRILARDICIHQQQRADDSSVASISAVTQENGLFTFGSAPAVSSAFTAAV